MIELDQIDRRIIRALQDDGRMSNLDLAAQVGLSPTPCNRRVKRLEEAGVIKRYAAIIDPAAFGMGIGVIVNVKLAPQNPDAAEQFLVAVQTQPEVTECMLVTGSVDYLLRVWVKDIAALRAFITMGIQSLPCVASTETMVILDATTFSRP